MNWTTHQRGVHVYVSICTSNCIYLTFLFMGAITNTSKLLLWWATSGKLTCTHAHTNKNKKASRCLPPISFFLTHIPHSCDSVTHSSSNIQRYWRVHHPLIASQLIVSHCWIAWLTANGHADGGWDDEGTICATVLHPMGASRCRCLPFKGLIEKIASWFLIGHTQFTQLVD